MTTAILLDKLSDLDEVTARFLLRMARFRRLHARMKTAFGARYLILLRGMRCGRCKGTL